MDRFQVAATGVSLGASGLLLALGVGLVCDARVREQDAHARMERSHRVAVARTHSVEQDRLAREQADDIQALRAQVVASRGARTRARLIPTREVANDSIDVVIRELEGEGSHQTYSANNETADVPELAPIRAAVLTGDLDKVREAVAQHNALGGEPVYLHDDPELARRGVAVRARWDHSRSFGVTLEATASDPTESCTVLVAPGAIVRSGGDGYQDTAPIQARFIHVGPKQPTNQASADICCAEIHSEDPRSRPSRGVTSHKDKRVALVTAAAEREHASWGAAQVALWAVANNVTQSEVAGAPGNYASYIDPARDVLEAAGIDTNKLPLYSSANPRYHRGSLDMDLLGRIRGG